MRVLVTGGAGYVGSHVVRALLESGDHQVVVLDNLSSGHRGALEGALLVEGDLTQPSDLRRAFDAAGPVDAVMHFAGLIQVGESVREPGRYFRVNLGGGLALLEAMVERGVRSLVFSSTAAVYGNPSTVPIPEDHPKEPTSPYGESKWFFERVLARFLSAHELRSVSLRYFNAAGAHPSGELGEDHHPESHLIPLALEVAAGKRLHLSVFGTDYPTPDGTCIRDYIHVMDLARAHLLALEALAAGEPVAAAYNLGNGNGYSVREVIQTCERVTGRPIPVEEVGRRPGDPAVLVASSEAIRRDLGWRPEYPELETIVSHAWRWHQSHPRGFGG